MKTGLLKIVTSMCMAHAMVLPAVGCKREVAAPGQSATAATPTQPEPASAKVAKIVFIGKKNACDCTRKRIDGSFAVLQTALGGRSEITTQRLQVDIDEGGVTQYRKLRPIMVLPAIYLLEASGALVDVLQGEVTVEQLQKAIGGKKTPRPSATPPQKKRKSSGG